MPTIRESPGSPLAKSKRSEKRCRVYPTHQTALYFDWCMCQNLSGCHHPVVEGIFADRNAQPWIHDCIVTVIDHKKAHHFLVSVKNHADLPVNQSLPKSTNGIKWRGDIVILRCGIIDPETFVNMRKGDDKLTDFLVSRFVQAALQGPRLVIPADRESLVFTRRK
ncbi:hypothetical protein P691DRAFT_788892 [Macrolepiota fuliginosa MF-IS2]|uniref:Uncharacterized protein n=1 Tax=Macrolepiota fuliginosa MF-IS2 TaxID=1400762 RepID=A0A9P6BYU0_9AGAR|nr:hypothetical protein P691DRAFT_788892 [Macrolepiota fuliginosa MF-IS2]